MSIIKNEGSPLRPPSQYQSCSSISSPTHTVVKFEECVPPQPSTAAFRCEYCSQKFNLKQKLIHHTYEMHEDLSLPLKYQSDLQKHQCENCQKTFNDWSAFNNHREQRCHKNVFDCHVCQKVFKDKSILNRHLRDHLDEQPFICDVCQKAFKYKCDLNNHMRTHSSERPFSCEVCGKSFKQKSNLTAHVRVHSDER
eukprot:950338_1